MLALEQLLHSIDGTSISGQDLRYDPLFDDIREALREEDDSLPMGAWARQPKRADYPLVVTLAQDALQRRTKDLWLASWLGEAVLRLEGIDALPRSINLILGLHEQFWSSLYPQLEEGDAASRAAPVQWGLDRYTILVEQMPITEGGMTYAVYKAVRAGRSLLSTPEALDAELKATGRSFYVHAEEQVTLARQALDSLQEFCDNHYGADGPAFVSLRQTLEQLHGVIAQQLRVRQPQLPVQPVRHEIAPPHSEIADLKGTEVQEAFSAMLPVVAERDPGSYTPASWAEAMETMEACATYVIGEQLEHPVCYLLARAGQVGRGGDGGSDRSAPPSETRRNLKSAGEDKWSGVLSLALRALMEPTARHWLDLHHRIWQAAEAMDASSLKAFVPGVVDTLLASDPEWRERLFEDDTPVADEETRRWIERELSQEPEAFHHSETLPSMNALEDAESNPVAPSAWELVAQGETRGAIAMLQECARTARSGRQNFLCRIELCRLCTQIGEGVLAANLLQHLLEEVEERRLEQWEDHSLLGSLLTMLLNVTSADEHFMEDRSRLYKRLCRLDPTQALGFQLGR